MMALFTLKVLNFTMIWSFSQMKNCMAVKVTATNMATSVPGIKAPLWDSWLRFGISVSGGTDKLIFSWLSGKFSGRSGTVGALGKLVGGPGLGGTLGVLGQSGKNCLFLLMLTSPPALLPLLPHPTVTSREAATIDKASLICCSRQGVVS